MLEKTRKAVSAIMIAGRIHSVFSFTVRVAQFAAREAIHDDQRDREGDERLRVSVGFMR